MNAAEYTAWRRSLTPDDRLLVNKAARYHADRTADMLNQAFTAMKTMQERHNELDQKYTDLQTEIQDLQFRVIALEQFTYANSLEVP